MFTKNINKCIKSYDISGFKYIRYAIEEFNRGALFSI